MTTLVYLRRSAGILFAITSVAVAQNSPTPSSPTKVDPAKQAQELAAYRAGVDSALSLAKVNNVAGVEQTLIALNKAKPDTAPWHIETAQRLMLTAEQLARESRPAAILGLSTRALQHLALAETLAKDPRTRTAAKLLTGFIQERYLANRPAALAAYQAAAQLSPTSTRAKEAVSRLQQTDENLRSKIPGGGR